MGPPTQFVLHKCDNRKCVNVAHLFQGTAKDNAVDRDTKGRGADLRGADNPRTHLTVEDVLEIKAKYAEGRAQRKIAAEYNIRQPTVSRIVNNKRWVHT